MASKIYIDDKGERHLLEKMTTSHLINVLRHHEAQWDALDVRSLSNHANAVGNVLEAIGKELGSREPRTYLIDPKQEKVAVKRRIALYDEDAGEDSDLPRHEYRYDPPF
jgi:hypothetical protein